MKANGNKMLKVLILFLIVLLMGTIGYICYEKGFFNLGSKETSEKSMRNQENYEYKMVYPENSSGILIIKRNGQWYEYDSYDVEQGGSYASLIGEKDGKLYYIMNKSIKYIDLKDENSKPVVLVSASPKNYCKDNLNKGSIVGDRIYFLDSTSCHDSKLVSIDLNETSFDKAKTEVDAVNDYEVVDGNIFYNIGWDCSDYVFSRKNIETGKVESIGKGICKFEVNDNKTITYYLDNNKYDSEKNIWTYNEKSGCYNYDIATGKKTKIDVITYKLSSMDVEFYNGKVYYIDNNKLMKYENENVSKVYSQIKTDDYGNNTIIQMPTVIIDDVIMLNEQYLVKDEDGSYNISDENDIVIINGKKNSEKQAMSALDMYTVKMLDGSTKNFSIMDSKR